MVPLPREESSFTPPKNHNRFMRKKRKKRGESKYNAATVIKTIFSKQDVVGRGIIVLRGRRPRDIIRDNYCYLFGVKHRHPIDNQQLMMGNVTPGLLSDAKNTGEKIASRGRRACERTSNSTVLTLTKKVDTR